MGRCGGMAQFIHLEDGAKRRTPAYRRTIRIQNALDNLCATIAATDDIDRVQAALDRLQEAIEQAKIGRAGG